MTKPKIKKAAKPEIVNPVGRPSDFKPEYCDALERHMSQGFNFKAFGAEVKCAENTLYTWLKHFPEFQESKKRGEALLERHYTAIGQQMALGRLTRVKKRKAQVVDGPDGKPVPLYDRNGEIVYEEEMEPATGNATAWIFLCKNILKWKDRNNVVFSVEDESQQLTDEQRSERDRRIEEHVRIRQLTDDNGE